VELLISLGIVHCDGLIEVKLDYGYWWSLLPVYHVNQGRVHRWWLRKSTLLKPTKVTLFTIILYNSEQNI